MYYIDDYRKRAIDKIIPYLIDYPQIVQIIENSADRYQVIEDLLWNIANNFKVVDSRGVFLDAHAKNEVIDIIYTDKAEDAFTYGTDKPLYQAYGTGHYYSQASYISGIRKNISEDKLIRAVQAKIIQNNTNCTIEDLIEGLKLLYNATRVKIYESNPLNLSIMLEGSKIELSSSGNYENIKKMLAGCVNLNNVYVNPNQFDIFTYDENSSYGESRYPVKVGETVDLYSYISQSVTLDSEFEEYVETKHECFNNNMFCCIVGTFTKIEEDCVLFSSINSELQHSIEFGIKHSEGTPYFYTKYNGIEYLSDVSVQENAKYSITILNDNGTFKVWIFNTVLINGIDSSEDVLKILNRISNIPSDISISDYETNNASIVINCKKDGDIKSDFGNFTYYAVLFGNTDLLNQTINCTEYYASCYGEKQILFNCLENKNHLFINTQNPLLSNIMTRQSYYNYKAKHSNGKYLYLDGKSNIEYKISEEIIPCYITNMDISFDICSPVEVKGGTIVNGLINEVDDASIFIDNESENNMLVFKYKYYNEENELQEYYFYSNIPIENDKFYNVRFVYSDNEFVFYNNGIETARENFEHGINNLGKTILIGSDSTLQCNYKGFVKNVNINLTGTNEETVYNKKLTLPYKTVLKTEEDNITYTNFGARFITTPQLINDTTNLDLYGNKLMGIRA